MTTAFILFPPTYLQRDAFFSDSQPTLIAAYQDNRYVIAGTAEVGDLEGHKAAEECFDLTNNPSRNSERAAANLSRVRSVSVGDIIKVGSAILLCAGTGWTNLSSPD